MFAEHCSAQRGVCTLKFAVYSVLRAVCNGLYEVYSV